MAKMVTEPDASPLGHISGIQEVEEERQEQQGVGVLWQAFPEVGCLERLFREKEGRGSWEERIVAGEKQALSSLSPEVSSEKSQECISLQGIHCGRGGSNGFALVTSCRNRRGRPYPLPAQGAKWPW